MGELTLLQDSSAELPSEQLLLKVSNSLSRGSNFGYHWSHPNFYNSYLVILVIFLVVFIFPANVV